MNRSIPKNQIKHKTPLDSDETSYMSGFGNDFETEALTGALPQGRNSPQKCNYGLYGEQLSGTAFTAPGHQNERTWCYKMWGQCNEDHTRRMP